MEALDVEFVDEGVEAGLLLRAVPAGRSGGLPLEGQVHVLVAGVLLGLARLDAFDGDAQPEPPHEELGEAVGDGEGQAVVGTDGLGQAALAKKLHEGLEGALFLGGFKGFHSSKKREAWSVTVSG